MPSLAKLPRLDSEPWLRDPALHAVLAALDAGGHGARVVGGAVRNALFGRPVADVDIATTSPPEEVMRLARAAGLHAIPTGIEHGTVTVVARHRPFEVTTLRRDIETFGRHARVTYTTDWSEDAARRDFTINALYCAADGTLFDPLGGWPDIVARRVRFIGDARERIREDFLRILRFFRFTAEYAEGASDADGLAACVAEAAGLEGLSGERLRAEMMKLVVAPRALPVLEVMERSGILARIVGPSADVTAFARLAAIEAALGRTADAPLRLACLAASTPADAAFLRQRLKLSNAEAALADLAAETLPAASPAAPESLAKLHLYRHGAAALEAATLVAWARSGEDPSDSRWRQRFFLPSRFPRPVMPVRGSDVLALGVSPGPGVGRIMAAFETWWIAAGFPDDAAVVAKALAEITARVSGNQFREGD